MSQVTYNNEKRIAKKVKFQNDTGADVTIRGGWLVVYDRDLGTATDADESRAIEVEINATGNSKHFAGVIDTRYDGKVVVDGGELQMEILVPTADGQLVEIWTDQNCTIETTVLTLQPASHIAGGIEEGVPVAVAMQTVDRSSTAGTVLALLKADPQVSVGGNVSARSRAATALPTDALWEAVPIEPLKNNPFYGSLLDTDFTHGDGYPTNSYTSATYAAAAEGKTETEHIVLGGGVIGELRFFTTTDHQIAAAQWAVPIDLAGNPWSLEFRSKQSVLTDTKANWFIGLAVELLTLEDALTDAGALTDGGALGFQLKEADGDAIGVVYDELSQTQNEHDGAFAVPVADTYNTFGLHYNGTTIQMYLDGVSSGTAISAADIAAADFPTSAILFPTVYLKGAHADDYTLTLDWFRVAQHAA